MKLQIDTTIRCPYCQKPLFVEIDQEGVGQKGVVSEECKWCRSLFGVYYKVSVKAMGKIERKKR